MTVDDLVAFVRDRDRDRWAVFAQQGSEPDDDDVRRLEQRVGFGLPDDFRELLVHPLGGLVLEASEQLWPPAQPFDVGPAWTFLRGLFVPSLSPDAPDWLSLERVLDERLDGRPGLVPCLRVMGDADTYCIDATGRLVRWRHDDPDEPLPVGGGFYDLLLAEIAELDQRIDRMVARRAGEG